jgi:hypothetical protein
MSSQSEPCTTVDLTEEGAHLSNFNSQTDPVFLYLVQHPRAVLKKDIIILLELITPKFATLHPLSDARQLLKLYASNPLKKTAPLDRYQTRLVCVFSTLNFLVPENLIADGETEAARTVNSFLELNNSIELKMQEERVTATV